MLSETLDDGRVLMAVADGMGGRAAGEVASALAVETLLESVREGEDLAEAFRRANRSVQTRAQEPDKRGMGTTLVVMLLDGDSYWIGNVGDSRAYLISGEGVRQITEDHSFVAEAVKQGQSGEAAEASRWRNALTRAIGTDPEVEVDVFGPFPVESNTAVLLCSDGLYKTLPDRELAGIYSRSGSPEGAAQSLVAAALEGGSDDNISVAIAEFGEVPRAAPAGTMEFEWEPPEEAEDRGGDAGTGASPAEGERSEPARPLEAGVGSGKTGHPWGVTVGVVLAVAVLVWLWALLR